MDWQAFSREAVSLMTQRNDRWTQKWGLAGAPYAWDLETAEIVFRGGGFEVIADLCVAGTASASAATFLWSWADQQIPEAARKRIHEVREFGETHRLPLLTGAHVPGGGPEATEAAAIAARLLDAEGLFIDRATSDVTLYFLLSGFRPQNYKLQTTN